MKDVTQDSLEGRRNIGCYEFTLRSDIDVDRLLRDLPNILFLTVFTIFVFVVPNCLAASVVVNIYCSF
uniref:Transmembrane protein n=1 Tax=Heterorhabditis bacteriophora TaxID=37862 RepID=A0A1I7X226_HETBA